MIDALMGLLAVFVVVAATSSALVELWVRLWGLRLRWLRASLIDLLDCQPQARPDCPERQSAERLSDALLAAYRRERALDVIPGHLPPPVFARLLQRLAEMHPPALRRHLEDITHGTHDPQAAVAQWFATAMEEVSARWRLRTRLRLACMGIVLAVVANIDALFLLRYMLADPSTAQALSERVLATFPASDDYADLSQTGQLWGFLMQLPVGWPPASWHWAVPVGWLLTGCAAAAGAPFWWDLLRSVVRLRGAAASSAGGSKEVSVKQAPPSEADAQPPALPDTQRVRQALDHWPDPAARAVVLAACSAVAYEPPWRSDAWWQALGIRAAPFSDAGVGTQGVVLDLGPAAAVIFRGTEMRVEDWATDARFVLTRPAWLAQIAGRSPPVLPWWQRLRQWWRRQRGDLPLVDTRVGSPAIHSGFNEGLSDALRMRIGQLLRDLRGGEGVRGCFFAGHSLGGALATLAAARAQLLHGSEAVAEVHTFGQPRVGNAAFAAWYQRYLGSRHFAYAGLHDPISLLPPLALGYTPVGQLRLLDDSGRVESNPPAWYQHLAQGAAFWHDGTDALGAGGQAHGIHATLDHLLTWWDTQRPQGASTSP